MNGKQKYADIINLPHHVSAIRPQMSMTDRAAQFSPFAALTGYDAAIHETGRLTDDKIELDEETLNILNMKLRLLVENLDDKEFLERLFNAMYDELPMPKKRRKNNDNN